MPTSCAAASQESRAPTSVIHERARNAKRAALSAALGKHASHDVRDTSRTAYAEQRASGRLNNTQQRIVDLLRAHPGRDYTRSEIGRALRLPANVFSGRVNELIHVKRLLEEKRRRQCAVSGKVVYAVGLR